MLIIRTDTNTQEQCTEMRCLYPERAVRTDEGIRSLYTHRCGGCISCRITKRQQWVLRMLMEAKAHEGSMFITMTYADEKLPTTEDGVPTLRKDHLQKFFKKLRKRGVKFRYFACGEYGMLESRPHYHAILFGLPHIPNNLVQPVWGHGFTHVQPMNVARARYTAGYTIKKLTRPEDWPDGRDPEFATMSRKEGLGSTFIDNLALKLKEKGFTVSDNPVLIEKDPKVIGIPEYLRLDGVTFPTDQYTRERIAKICSGEMLTDRGKRLLNDMSEIGRVQQSVEEFYTEIIELEEKRELAQRQARRLHETL